MDFLIPGRISGFRAVPSRLRQEAVTLRPGIPVMRAIRNTIRGARTEGSLRRQRMSLSRSKNVVCGIVKIAPFLGRFLPLKQ